MKPTETNNDVPDFLANMEADLEQGLLPIRVFNNQQVYDLELRRIFARSWVYIGHESEIPNRGDYATRYIGEDPFIFIRDDDGVVRVLLNSCRHRGAQVCRASAGNTTHFSCPFHGWTYKNNGQLVGVPAKSQGYRELQTSEWGLFAAPKVASYCGLVFANLDPDAIPFEEYIGKYQWYLDMQFKLTAGGMEVIGEPQRWVVDANWKQGAENFCGDSSHTQMTHRSALDAGIVRAAAAGAPGKNYGLHVHECDGHAISIRQLEEGQSVFWDYPEEVTSQFGSGGLSEVQLDLARRALVHNGTVFPNFSFLHFGLTDSPDKPAAGYLSLRVWQPKGPGKTEIWNWILAPKEASESYKQRAFQVGMSSFGPSGSFEQDDVAVWPGVARSASTVFAEMNNVKVNYQMGLRGMGDVQPIADWPGPGVAVPSNAGEGGLRTFHRTWFERIMRTTDLPGVCGAREICDHNKE
jgi:phenylpropionate dioxygenase-like ring-hydroxylating dioxygenase large terminal subunit